MTPGEIHFSFQATVYGKMLFASSDRGLCLASFLANDDQAIAELSKRFESLQLLHKDEPLHRVMAQLINCGTELPNENGLDLRGTDFQLAVWRALLTIPRGMTVSYGEIALRAGHPRAFQAVGTAVGCNPVAVLIPCHRVIKSDGSLGGYRWGENLKRLILSHEKAHPALNNERGALCKI